MTLDRSKFREQWAAAVETVPQAVICHKHRHELVLEPPATEGGGPLLSCPEEGCPVRAELVVKEAD